MPLNPEKIMRAALEAIYELRRRADATVGQCADLAIEGIRKAGKAMKGPDVKSGRCGGCDAPIYWVTSKHGRPMPMNPPEKRFVVEDGVAIYMDTYTSHFANCPKADQFRREFRGEPVEG